MQRKSLADEIRDDMYRFKLGVLNQRIQNEKDKPDGFDNNLIRSSQLLAPTWMDTMNYERDLQIRQMNDEINAAKLKYEKLREKLKTQKLEKKIESSLNEHNSSVDRTTSDKFLEMLMIQQTQTQNMLMNKLLLKSNQDTPAQPMVCVVSGCDPKYHHYVPLPYTSPRQNSPKPPQELPVKQATPIPTPKPSTPNIPPENVIQKPPIMESKEILSKTKNLPPKRFNIYQPYPGNQNLQALRQLGLAALFCSILDSNYEENSLAITDKFLFELKLEEVLTAIQKIYVKPDSPIPKLIQSIVSNDEVEFRKLLTKPKKKNEFITIEQVINYFLENLISRVSEIMPTSGTLGCESRSILSEVLQTNQTFPNQFFFVQELELIQIDATNTTRNIGALEAQAILIGIFYVRALIMTVIMKSTEYKLTEELSLIGKDNLRIISTIIIRIYRILLADFIKQRTPQKDNKKLLMVSRITELGDYILSDEEIEPIMNYVKKSIEYCKTTILKWANTYVTKLKPT